MFHDTAFRLGREALAFGPDGAVWYDADSGYPTGCNVELGRETTKGDQAFVQLSTACPKIGTTQLPTAFAGGTGRTLWYTRGNFVGKIQL